MANHKSAIKRHRQSLVRRDSNRIRKAAVRTAIKKAIAAAAEGKKDEAAVLAKSAESMLAKATKRGLYHKATMSRKVSRLSLLVNKTTAPKTPASKTKSKKA
jgi:small subunit ribosomal protein S20